LQNLIQFPTPAFAPDPVSQACRYGWNHKRVYRIYCELALDLRIKLRKRLKRDKPVPLAVHDRLNETWSMDFMAGLFADSQSIRKLNVLNDFNCEGLCIEVDFAACGAGGAQPKPNHRMVGQDAGNSDRQRPMRGIIG